MTIRITSNNAVALSEAVTQLETLASKPQLTKQEERTYNLLLSKVSLLKAGLNPSEIANAEAERLARSSGLATIPGPVSDEVEREWRDWINRKNVRHFHAPQNHEVREIRAAEAGTQSITNSSGAVGGYFVPFGYDDRNLMAMRAYDQIFDDQFCNPITTLTGQPTTAPALDDTANASVQIAENTNPQTTSDFSAAVVQLEAYSFRSGLVFVSLELLQDSGTPISGLLEVAFAYRHARGAGKAFIQGTGVNSPLGLATAALASGNGTTAIGAAATTGGSQTGANSIGPQDLLATWQLLNRAYRREASWAMSDDTFIAVSNLLDKSGRPLVRYSNEIDQPVLYGRPVCLCPSMSDIAPSAITVILYAPRFFLVRRVPSGSYLRIYREVTGAVEKGDLGFQSYFRTDSNLALTNSAYPPIAYLQQHS